MLFGFDDREKHFDLLQIDISVDNDPNVVFVRTGIAMIVPLPIIAADQFGCQCRGGAKSA
jgi:hypothetical protein